MIQVTCVKLIGTAEEKSVAPIEEMEAWIIERLGMCGWRFLFRMGTPYAFMEFYDEHAEVAAMFKLKYGI